jgi:MFS family permease
VEFSIILSPYLGPLITAFIVYKTTWPWAFWVCTILWAIGFILLLFFIDETLFDRHVPASQRVPRGPHWQRTLGIEQAKGLKNRSFFQSVMRPIIAITKIPVFAILVFYFLNFAWYTSLT